VSYEQHRVQKYSTYENGPGIVDKIDKIDLCTLDFSKKSRVSYEQHR
jgi:hypothetical protein